MINVSGLSKQFGPQVLFEGVTLQLNPRERYGLVGANGSGKTTFMKVLTGDESADGGDVTFGREVRLGVLRQDQFENDKERIVDVAMAGDAPVFHALRRLEAVAAEDGPDAHEIAELGDRIAHGEGYTLEARAREILVGLGIPGARLNEPLSVLSGGFKLRVLLAQVLVGRPDVLLLDEPTNHLDILSIRWLEDFLRNFAGCAVVISHDRRFLDRVTTRILDVDYRTITDYPGNYTTFVSAKELAAEQRNAEIQRAEKAIAEKKAFVERFRAKATKARQAQSRVKQIEKIEVKEVVKTTRRAPLFRFEQERPTGKDVLTLEGISKSYGDTRVLSSVEFRIKRGEKIGVIGANGIGKSTLLKIIAGVLSPDEGGFEWGVHAKVGYFAQDHHELLHDPAMTPLDFVYAAVPQKETSYVRGQLGRMLFSGDEVEKKVTTLSGGEAARLIFARISVERPNVLILDEPTNHLDIEAIEALAEALRSYEGTVVFVSHDRWFVSYIASRIIELKPQGLVDFPGTYDEYLEKDGADHLDHDAVSLKAKAEQSSRKEAPGPLVPVAAPLSYEERKRRANRLKSLPKKRDTLLSEIDVLESRIEAIQSQFADPSFYTTHTEAEQMNLRHEREQLESTLDGKMSEWEKVEQELTQLEAEPT